MRPIIKKNVAIFYPQGFLDGMNANTIIEPSDVNFTVLKRPKAVFISLKRVIFFNKKGLSVALAEIKAIQEQIHCAIGFCEYDKKMYSTIISMFNDELDFSLFENQKVLSLFFDEKIEDEQKILIYSENSEQKNQLAIELYEVGHRPYVAKDKEDFLEKKDEYTKYGVVITLSYIANVDTKINVYIKHNMIFYNLKNFIDSDIVKKFDLDYHNNLLRVGFKVFVFDISRVSSMNVHGVNFFAKLSTAGAEYGTTFCMIGVNDKKLNDQQKNDLEDSGIILYESMEEFEADEEIKKDAIKGGKTPTKSTKLTKKIISQINTLVDTTIHITQMLSQKNGEKKSAKVDSFKVKDEDGLYVCLFGIYGHIEAMFTIVFSKALLLDTCKIFLSDDANDDDIYDSMVEYANIVASKIKSNFKLHRIDVEVTLPRAFRDKDQALEFFGDRKGVLVELDFDGEILELFLSK